MKKLIALSLIFILSASIYADNIYWYLAASMTTPGKEITTLYNNSQTKNHVTLLIGGSGELLSKIKASGFDGIYTPASGDFLVKAEKMGIVERSFKFLKQFPVIGLAENNASSITTFNQFLNSKIKMAVGNPNTMALGETYLQIKQKMPKNEAAKLTSKESAYAVNVGEIVTYVKLGVVGSGTMYNTDAAINKIKYVEIPKAYNIPSYAYMVILKNSNKKDNPEYNKNIDEFLSYVNKNSSIFEKYGFNTAKLSGK